MTHFRCQKTYHNKQETHKTINKRQESEFLTTGAK